MSVFDKLKVSLQDTLLSNLNYISSEEDDIILDDICVE